jgi:hypothetical protein
MEALWKIEALAYHGMAHAGEPISDSRVATACWLNIKNSFGAEFISAEKVSMESLCELLKLLSTTSSGPSHRGAASPPMSGGGMAGYPCNFCRRASMPSSGMANSSGCHAASGGGA